MNRKELVFGPAEDGGYWLIAAQKPVKNIFENIDWSTNRVLAQSTNDVKRTVSLLRQHITISIQSQSHATSGSSPPFLSPQ